MAKFQHARKGPFEGDILNDDGEWLDIRLTAGKPLLGHGDPIGGSGFRSVFGQPGDTIRVRKSLVTQESEQ